MIDWLHLSFAFSIGWASCVIFQCLGTVLDEAREFLDRSAADDPFGDRAYGDEPFIPADDLKALFHASQLIRETQRRGEES